MNSPYLRYNRWMNTSKPPRNGIIQKVLVMEQTSHAIIGSGWVLYRDDAKMMAPELFDLMGNKMPEGWYTLQVTDDVKTVVIPRMVQ